MTLGEASSHRSKLQEPRLGGGKELGEFEVQRCWGGGREGDEVRKVMAQHARPGR